MNDNAGKLLVVESDEALRGHIVTVLSDAGYEVSSDYREGMKAVLAFNPDAVVLGADPPQLDCCDLLSEIKIACLAALVLGGSGPLAIDAYLNRKV